MAKIYRPKDRITVKIDDLVFKLAPLSLQTKTEIHSELMKGKGNMDIREATRGMAMAIKHVVKNIDGLFDVDGNKYVLEVQNNVLSDACVDDLLNLDVTEKLSIVCIAMLQGVPAQFKYPNGNPIPGVEVVN